MSTMIAFLQGRVIQKQEKSLVIQTGGVGYLLISPRSFIEKVQMGEERSVFVHTHVREDELSLFGFESQDDLSFFKLLISVSGIGPRSALEVLNQPTAKIKRAIAQKEVAVLTQISGIGRKTAERIIVDLQGKIKEELSEEGRGPEANGTPQEEIVQALVSLGYHRAHVLNGLKKIPAEISGEEAVIKYFLQNT